jgi:hypothetical protein
MRFKVVTTTAMDHSILTVHTGRVVSAYPPDHNGEQICYIDTDDVDQLQHTLEDDDRVLSYTILTT